FVRVLFFFFQAEDGIRDFHVTGVQTCALPISGGSMPIEFVIRSTADHEEMQDFANQLLLYANTEANEGGGAPTFYFADMDLKFRSEERRVGKECSSRW